MKLVECREGTETLCRLFVRIVANGVDLGLGIELKRAARER